MIRKFIHIDLDAFYASVEQLDNPTLKGQPVIVGGSPQSRGVVATASYEARKFGVRSAIPCSKALRLCPHAVFVRPRFQRYKEISQKIRNIFFEVTPLVEPLSLDEAYLDVTDNYLNEPSAQRVAGYLRQRIFDEIGLTASAGVAPLKFVAKIASDMRKPNGLTVIGPGKIDEFICSLPVAKLWSVGPATEKKLKSLGIEYARDFRQVDLAEIHRHLGKHGQFLYDLAHGIDRRQVKTERKIKSRGSERTFAEDITQIEFLEGSLRQQTHEVSSSMQKAGLIGKTVTIKVRYNDFQTVTRSKSLACATDNEEVLFSIAKEKLISETEAGVRPVRLLGVSVSGFGDVKSECNQLQFSL